MHWAAKTDDVAQKHMWSLMTPPHVAGEIAGWLHQHMQNTDNQKNRNHKENSFEVEVKHG